MRARHHPPPPPPGHALIRYRCAMVISPVEPSKWISAVHRREAYEKCTVHGYCDTPMRTDGAAFGPFIYNNIIYAYLITRDARCAVANSARCARKKKNIVKGIFASSKRTAVTYSINDFFFFFNIGKPGLRNYFSQTSDRRCVFLLPPSPQPLDQFSAGPNRGIRVYVYVLPVLHTKRNPLMNLQLIRYNIAANNQNNFGETRVSFNCV